MTYHFPATRLSHDDAGLSETLAVVAGRERLARRRMLRRLGAALLLATPLPGLACTVINEETEGPYPGDGTNGPNALTQSGILRSDIRSSFGSAGTATAAGTALSVTLSLVNTSASCASLSGYAIYLWHCDAQGRYSLYSSGVTAQNYLRGVQVTDSSGQVTFTSIFPACYSGRWPHIHFEVYASVTQATNGANAVRTSQVAMPEAACKTVYAQTALYPSSTANLASTSLARDNVFGDDSAAHQLATVTGSNAAGYAASLEVGIAAGSTGGGTAPGVPGNLSLDRFSA